MCGVQSAVCVAAATARIAVYVPSAEMVAHGSGGYMKAALWIWSDISSSSLKGKVPDKLKQQHHNEYQIRSCEPNLYSYDPPDVHYDPNRPEVKRAIVTLTLQNFRGCTKREVYFIYTRTQSVCLFPPIP